MTADRGQPPRESILDREPDSGSRDPRTVLVAGASGGIGGAFCHRLAQRFPGVRIVRLARAPDALPPLAVHTDDVHLDLGSESSIRDALATMPDGLSVDWAFIATGWLHDDRYRPEKTFKSLDAEHLVHAYRINAVGPALILKHLIPSLSSLDAARIGVVSARVGSISDNRMGGWHAYRASKAALNMLIRNFAIELKRRKPSHIIVGLQPGTTDTALSAPFQRNVPAGELQTPEYTARQLLQVMQRLKQEDSGNLYDFLGIPFDP